MANPATALSVAYAGIQLAQYIFRRIELMNRGELTPEEVQAEWEAMQSRLDMANERWEASAPE